jgi:hypothetical protein
LIIDDEMLLMPWIAIQTKKIYGSGVLRKDVENRDISKSSGHMALIPKCPALAPLRKGLQHLSP